MIESLSFSRSLLVRALVVLAIALGAVGQAAASGIVVLRGGDTPTVWFYEAALQRWSQLADLPMPVGAGAAITVWNNDVFVLRGGGTSEFYKLQSFPTPAWIRMPDFPEPVSPGSALVLNTNIGGLWAIGGGGTTNAWSYDLFLNTWNTAGSLPAPAGPDSAIAFSVFFGFEVALGGASQTFQQDLSGNWLPTGTFPFPIGSGAGLAAAHFGCDFALPGGLNGRAFYSLSGVCGFGSRAPLPVFPGADASLFASQDSDDLLWALAGSGSRAMFHYSVSDDAWTRLIDTPGPLGLGSGAAIFRGATLGVPITYPLPMPPFGGSPTITIDPPMDGSAVIWGNGFPKGCESSALYAIAGATATGLGAFGTYQGSWGFNFNYPPAADTADAYRWLGSSNCNGYLFSGANPGGVYPRTISLHDDTIEGVFAVSPASLTFPPTPIGTLSPAQTLSVQNPGSGPLLLRDTSFYGGNQSDFRISFPPPGMPGTPNPCFTGRILEAGGSCNLNLQFRPSADGLRTSAIGFAHTDGDGFTLIPLSGGELPDTTAPVITCSASPSAVWPPNGKMVPVSIAVVASDAGSGLSGYLLVNASSDEGAAGDITGFAVGTTSTSGAVRAKRNGGGTGRTYSFTYRATDRAGNSASCTATVLVPHDQGR